MENSPKDKVCKKVKKSSKGKKPKEDYRGKNYAKYDSVKDKLLEGVRTALPF